MNLEISKLLSNTSHSNDNPRVRGVWESLNYSKPLAALLSEIYHSADPFQVSAEVDRAAALWACISAKSDREEKRKPGWYYSIEQFQRLTVIKPIYERIKGSKPPSRNGETIHKFSKRSRQRLLNKARTMQTDKIELPYFVTLTYHKNYADCEGAKIHLQNFFKRWRRICESEKGENRFKYMWKMEPQKRGAVHFHVAMYLPADVKNKFLIDSKKPNERLKKLREKIGRQWAEVTAEINGNIAEFTEFDYIRKARFKAEQYGKKIVNTLCKNPRLKNYYAIGFDGEHYGTNVREVENAKMAIGYMAKYIGKEVEPGAFGSYSQFYIEPQKTGRRKKNLVHFSGKNVVKMLYGEREEFTETGRFWGFSNNFDFTALYSGAAAAADMEKVQNFANEINEEALQSFLIQQTQNVKRLNERKKNGNVTEKKYTALTEIIYRSVSKQLRRYKVNKEKILRGYSIQLEVCGELSYQIQREHHFDSKEYKKILPGFEN